MLADSQKKGCIYFESLIVGIRICSEVMEGGKRERDEAKPDMCQLPGGDTLNLCKDVQVQASKCRGKNSET